MEFGDYLKLVDFPMIVNTAIAVFVVILVVPKLYSLGRRKHFISVVALFVALLCIQFALQTTNWRGLDSVWIAIARAALPIFAGYLLAILGEAAARQESKGRLKGQANREGLPK
jgi:hypothetical protein